MLLTIVTVLYVTTIDFFKWEFSTWLFGKFSKLLAFSLPRCFGTQVFFSVKSQKHYSQEMIFCSVKLGQSLLSQITESWVLTPGIKTNSKWMITEKNLRYYKPCPKFPACHSQASLSGVSLPQTYSSNTALLDRGNILLLEWKISRITKHFCQLFSCCFIWLGWYAQMLSPVFFLQGI